MVQIPIPTLVLITQHSSPKSSPYLPSQHQISANLLVTCRTNIVHGQSCNLNQLWAVGGVEWYLAGPGIPLARYAGHSHKDYRNKLGLSADMCYAQISFQLALLFIGFSR